MTSKFFAIVVVVASMLAPLSGVAALNMGIPGQFEVSPVGAATYVVPIQVPPGIAGIEPRLSLNYSSRSGNGLLGVGWTLDGLPSIVRCPRTTPQDGAKGGVGYDTNDRFCIDGKRLMLVSGTYGAAGSEYRTEIDSFLKITAQASAGSGPESFVVKTKDGLTLELGGSADSRVAAANTSSIRVWAINKVSDAMGNTQRIAYGLPPAIAGSTSEYNAYPLKIEYTSNSGANRLAGSAVEFAYETRPDPLLAYQGGKPFRVSVRLTGIVTKTGGSTVSTYTPTYSPQADARSTMDSLGLCAGDGHCSPVTKFKLGGTVGGRNPLPSPSIVPVAQSESSVSGGKWVTLDVNGDGVTDLIHFTELSGVYRVWMSKGDGTFSIQEVTVPGSADTSLSTGEWKVLDVNGDGLADLVHLTATAGTAKVWKSNGDGTFAITTFNSGDNWSDRGGWLVLDVNGDGLADLVRLVGSLQFCIFECTEQMRVWKSNGDGTFGVTSISGGGGTVLWLVDAPIQEALYRSKWQVLDVNGDGLADLVQLYVNRMDTSVHLLVRKSNGDGTFGVVRTQLLGPQGSGLPYDGNITRVFSWVPIDVNQDGLTDLVLNVTFRLNVNGQLLSEPNLNQSLTLISMGDGNFQRVSQPSSFDRPLVDGTWQVVDTNGDGLGDLIHTPSNLGGAGWYAVWRSKGDGTFVPTRVTQSVDSCTSNCMDMFAGDFTANGAQGFLRVDGNVVKSAWFLGSQPSSLLTGVSNGAGQVLSWDISVLPAVLGDSYVKDVPSDTSTWTLSSAIPVVTKVRKQAASWTNSDSTVGRLDRATTISYGSARVERNGRGFVGFLWQQSADSVTGLRTRTTYRQDFPFIGLVASQSTGSGGSWDNLSKTTTSYAALAAGALGADPESVYGCRLSIEPQCGVAAGKRYFVYPEKISTQKRDLDGSSLPGVQIVNGDPDRFGNLRSETTSLLNPDGSTSEYLTQVTSTFYNDPSNWIIGRLTKRVTDRTGPTIAAPTVPGSGGLPPAPEPRPSAQTTAALMAIIQLLLSDD